MYPKNLTIFFCQCYRFIYQCYFFLINVTAKAHSFFTSCKIFSSWHNKFSIISSYASQSLSRYHYLFNNKNTCAEIETKINFISSIWDDDHILRHDEKNWQCLWCNTSFQGINATKAIDHVLGEKGVHIKSCYAPKDKSHITRYQELQHFKQAWKGILRGYPENIKEPISSLQNNSSSAIEYTINHISKGITSSNNTNISEI